MMDPNQYSGKEYLGAAAAASKQHNSSSSSCSPTTNYYEALHDDHDDAAGSSNSMNSTTFGDEKKCASAAAVVKEEKQQQRPEHACSGGCSDDDGDALWKTTPAATAADRIYHEYCGQIIHSHWFQQTILCLIVFNSILTATATFDFVTEHPNTLVVFETTDTVLLCIFTGELWLHLYYYGWSFFRDPWLNFDFTLVTLSWAFQAMSALRSFRILRAVRLMSHLKEMKDLVQALFHVMPRMFAISKLLVLIYFVFAVLFTSLFQNAYQDGITSEDHFSRLDITAFTLLQFMFLDNWSGLTKELMAEYAWAWIPILAFIIICTFVVVNLIIAVICDAVQTIQKDEMSAQLHQAQQLTDDTIKATQMVNHEDIQRLESKMDRLLQLLEQQHRFTAANAAAH